VTDAETGKNIEAVDEAVIDLFMAHDFPGNIRELENALQHAFVLCKESVIQLAHLPRELIVNTPPGAHSGRLSLEDLEKKAIRDALLDHGGNRRQAARQLGIDPSTLYRKMKRYGIG